MYVMLIIYCCVIAFFSMMGGSLPSMVRLTHNRIQMILSLVSGVMLGVALLHLMPHSIRVLGDVDLPNQLPFLPTNMGPAELATAVCLFGLLFMFFMIRTFHFHQHDLAVDDQHDHAQKHLCDEDRHHVHCEHHDGELDFTWAGLCFGLAIHTLIDGIALASAVTFGPKWDWSTAGLGVFLAIVLHKPLDAMSITSLMAARGWNPSKQMTVNVLFATMCPLGALLFAFGIDEYLSFELRSCVLGITLAFSAGIFLCISLGDLLPEVHFHSHDRVVLSGMLILGVLIAIAIENFPGHEHKPQNSGKQEVSTEQEPGQSPDDTRPKSETPSDVSGDNNESVSFLPARVRINVTDDLEASANGILPQTYAQLPATRACFGKKFDQQLRRFLIGA